MCQSQRSIRYRSRLPFHDTPASIIAIVILQIINTLELREGLRRVRTTSEIQNYQMISHCVTIDLALVIR
uniref:Uncharacterized protein n=1 Tax=Arundo donax TaxID=35708 RepID=A0A0A9FBQ4_ARUDO